MTSAKIAGALGLCRRAGKITAGTYLVREEVRKGKAAIVLLASDAGRDAEKKLFLSAEEKSVPVKRIVLTKKELGACLGKSGEVVCVSVGPEFYNLVLASM